MEYEHPIYTPASVAAQRRLPECDTDRVVFAGAWHGWGFHEDGARSGVEAAAQARRRVGLESPLPAPVEPTSYATTIRHTRRKPFKRTFTNRSRTWLVDLDHLPDHGILGRFEARDHLGDPDSTLKANVENFLAVNGVETDGGRILMAANARALGHCFNPISVFWCHRRNGELAGVVVEVHNTYGDRHAYLVHPDAQGRARTPKQMYVSPFHGTDGHYEIAVPPPGERLHVSVTLHSDDGAVFSASLDGRAHDRLPASQRPRGPARRPAHPRPRHLAVGPTARDPPASRPPATGRRLMTTTPMRPATAWPGLDTVPSDLRTEVSARIARRLFRAAVSGCPSPSARAATPPARGARAGRRCGSSDPRSSSARLGRDGLIGFGEAYLTGAWDADDLGGFLTVLAAKLPTPDPGAAADAARGVRAPAAPRAQEHRRTTPGSNIAHHYDLSNDLFELFLDETLSYSSALFDTSLDRPRRPPAGRAAGGTRRRVARRGAAAQDRPAARPDRRRRGHPRARDRHRLGRAGHPGRRAGARPCTR